MGKTALISQSDYIPWRGYFDLIAAADVFVLLDDVQYTRRDWRNRNQVKTASGVQWITIPTVSKGKYTQRVSEAEVADSDWAQTHWKTLEHAYGKAPFFGEVAALLRPAYEKAAGLALLSQINRLFIETICGYLEIGTKLVWSTDLFALERLDGFDRNSRILELCKAVGAARYVSGPSAQNYMDRDAFMAAGVEVRFADYGRYPDYPQLHGAFTPHVSILDLLFNTGKKARDYTVGFAV